MSAKPGAAHFSGVGASGKPGAVQHRVRLILNRQRTQLSNALRAHLGPMFAGDIRHLDEMYVKLNGEMVYLWRAVDHEGEILESYVTRTRDKDAALRFMKKALERHGSPEAVTTDGLRSYKAAMNELGNAAKQELGRWADNRVENSHLPFRRRERAMTRFRRMKTLQNFASVHADVHNHFNLERHLVDRQTYKQRRSAALAEWQMVAS